MAGHDQALDLVGAFVDLGDFGVAHHSFDREVHRVAGAAEELDGVGGDGHGGVGGEGFGGGGGEGGVGGAAFYGGGGGGEGVGGGFYVDGHGGVHELDWLGGGDAAGGVFSLFYGRHIV